MAKEFYKVESVGSENKYLPTPLVIGEICQHIPEPEFDNQEATDWEKQFIKVYHNNGSNISTFSRRDFSRYKPKDKTELINLLKNKGRL